MTRRKHKTELQGRTHGRRNTNSRQAHSPDTLHISAIISFGLLAVLLVVCLLQLWTDLDYMRMDHTGHLAAGVSLMRVGFHNYTDSFFLGSIQNLFYPPFEDALLAVLLTTFKPVTAYKTLLSLILFLYFAAAATFSATLRSRNARLLWVAGFVMLLFADKSPRLTYLQGLSLFDFYITGLTSQILSTSLLILLIAAVRAGRRGWSAILFALCILSHIITAMVAFAFCAAWYALSRDRRFLVSSLIAMGITAFFWVPFLLHADMISSSRIVGASPWLVLAAAFVGVVSARGNRSAFALLATAAACALPSTVLNLIPQEWVDPYLIRFHFSRFAAYSFLLLSAGVAVYLEERSRPVLQYRALAAAALLIIPFGYYFHDRVFFFNDPRLKPADFNISNAPPPPESNGRLFVANHGGAAKFNIESMLYAQGIRDFHTRGLYWESNRNNTLLSSYAVGLYSLPAVINYYRITATDCRLRECVYEHFFSAYSVSEILVPRVERLRYREPAASTCDVPYFADVNRFDQVGSLVWDGWKYRWLRTKKDIAASSWLELLDVKDMRTFTWDGDWYYGEYFEEINRRCSQGDRGTPVFIDGGQEQAFHLLVRKATGRRFDPSVGRSFQRVKSGEYNIRIDSSHPVLFRVKLSYYPGFRLLDERGKDLPLLAAYGSIVGYGHGRMKLVYEKGWRFLLGYALTGLSSIGAAMFAYSIRHTEAASV